MRKSMTDLLPEQVAVNEGQIDVELDANVCVRIELTATESDQHCKGLLE